MAFKFNTLKKVNSNIILTNDGSHSLMHRGLNERYHSLHGALSESLHVFIQSGLNHHHKKKLRILEIGFGTGLNAFLTLIEGEKQNLKISYTGIELYPISTELAALLNYSKLLPPEYKTTFLDIHTSEWEQVNALSPQFELTKLQKDFSSLILNEKYDLIYFDAFSPNRQPEMWAKDRFQMLFDHANQGAILTTYSSKGVIRRKLISVGFTVERIPGPKGKREILRAIKK